MARGDRPSQTPSMSLREAVRAVFVDAGGSVFLMRIVEPSSSQGWWITPGGAIEPGEAAAAALRRETSEELGIDLAEVGTAEAVWHRRVKFSWDDQQIDQHETFYLIRCDRFDPPRCEDGDGEATYYPGEPRWWTTDELRSSSENIAPTGLADLLDRLLDRTALPLVPLDISV